MGFISNLISGFDKPEIDIDELVNFIIEETHVSRDIIELILDTEEIYLRMRGIIID